MPLKPCINLNLLTSPSMLFFLDFSLIHLSAASSHRCLGLSPNRDTRHDSYFSLSLSSSAACRFFVPALRLMRSPPGDLISMYQMPFRTYNPSVALDIFFHSCFRVMPAHAHFQVDSKMRQVRLVEYNIRVRACSLSACLHGYIP